jgi:uncharacterized protein (TIRG00374 family)
MSARTQNLIKIAVSAVALGLLILVLRDVNLSQAFAILLRTNIWILLLTLPLQALTIIIRLVRWKYQLLPFKSVSIWTLFSPLLISYAVGNITVTAIGAVPRVYLLNRRTGIDTGAATGTFIQEYYLDATAVVLWAVMVPFFVPLPAEFAQLQVFLAIILIGILAIGVAIVRRSSLTITVLEKQGLWSRGQSLVPAWIRDNIDSFGQGLCAAFAQPWYAFVILGTTIVNWIIETAIFWVILLALEIPFSFLQASVITVYSYIALGIPSAPGSVGTLDAAVATLILANGGNAAGAVAFIILLRIFLMGPSTIVGLALGWREGWLLTNQRRSKQD